MCWSITTGRDYDGVAARCFPEKSGQAVLQHDKSGEYDNWQVESWCKSEMLHTSALQQQQHVATPNAKPKTQNPYLFFV